MLKLPLVAVTIALAVPFSFAQEKDAPPPPPQGEHGPGKGPRGDRLKMMAEKLGLTDEQKTKVGAIIEEEMKAGKAIRDDKSLDREAARAKMQEVRKAHREQIRAVLTPEQQKKFDEMKENFGHGGPRKEKKEAKE